MRQSVIIVNQVSFSLLRVLLYYLVSTETRCTSYASRRRLITVPSWAIIFVPTVSTHLSSSYKQTLATDNVPTTLYEACVEVSALDIGQNNFNLQWLACLWKIEPDYACHNERLTSSPNEENAKIFRCHWFKGCA